MDEHQHDGEAGAPVDCSGAVAALYVYLDGELTEERRTLIAGHLDACHHCLEAFEFEVELRQVIARKCKDEVPVELRRKIADLLAEAAADGAAGTDASPASLGRP